MCNVRASVIEPRFPLGNSSRHITYVHIIYIRKDLETAMELSFRRPIQFLLF